MHWKIGFTFFNPECRSRLSEALHLAHKNETKQFKTRAQNFILGIEVRTQVQNLKPLRVGVREADLRSHPKKPLNKFTVKLSANASKS
jgi:hypothetical protein